MRFIKTIHTRLNNRPDSEHKQAFLRLAIVATGCFYFHSRNGFVPYDFHTLPGQTALTVLYSCVYSILIYAHIIFRPAPSGIRRVVGMIHDVSATSLFLYLGNETSALYLFVYPFVTIGNGFRFGVRYLIICAALSMVGLGWLFSQSDFWAKNTYISWGLALNYVMVASYTAYLLNQLRTATQKLEQMATQDPLTGLVNRQVFIEKLENAIIMNGHLSRLMGCVYFDLDGFKKVNDEAGHHVGDLLLKEVAKRVKASIRGTDVFARMGGDEFTIILDPIKSREDAEIVSKRIISSIESITEVDGKKVKVSASVGCVLFSPRPEEHQILSADVVTQADENMYRSKKAGKGTYTITDYVVIHHQNTGDEKIAS